MTLSPRAALRRILPPRAVEAYRVGRRVMSGLSSWPPANIYEQLYEQYALVGADAEVVGRGSFDHIGGAELAVLQTEGLRPSSTLADFGCGIGRLAVHAIPALPEGSYIGLDISQEMLRRLGDRLQSLPVGTCRVSLLHQANETFPLGESAVDMLCAFSVFTHMEHEDAYRYLKDARRVVRRGGRLVFSCLAMDSALGRSVFLEASAVNVQGRWANVRCVSTSKEMMQEIARLAGWTMVQWYPGDEENIAVPFQEAKIAFGQSIGVLE